MENLLLLLVLIGVQFVKITNLLILSLNQLLQGQLNLVKTCLKKNILKINDKKNKFN